MQARQRNILFRLLLMGRLLQIARAHGVVDYTDTPVPCPLWCRGTASITREARTLFSSQGNGFFRGLKRAVRSYFAGVAAGPSGMVAQMLRRRLISPAPGYHSCCQSVDYRYQAPRHYDSLIP